MADLGFAFGLEPEAAVKYFEGLGFKVPSDWQSAWSESQAKARAISGLYKQDLAAHFHQSLYDAMQSGKPFEAFRDDVKTRLAAAGAELQKGGDIVDTATGEILGSGITKQRMETIFRTQMQTAYMAGKWQSFQDTRNSAPYLQYNAILDNRTRASHAAAHGAVYHIDDPFWDYFYPPNGFNCRCTVRAFSDGDLKRRGLDVRQSELEDTHIVINKKGDTREAKALKLPDGRRFVADKGFEGNAGKNHLAQLGQLQMQRAVDLPPRLASVAINTALDNREVMQKVTRQMADMVTRVAEEKIAHGQLLYTGALPLKILDALLERGIAPQSAIIGVIDKRILHAIRDTKAQPLPLSFWKALPERLRDPEIVLLDDSQGKNALLLVFHNPEGKNKIVVTLDYEIKAKHPLTGKKEWITVNMVNTGAVVEAGKQLDSLLLGFEKIWEKL